MLSEDFLLAAKLLVRSGSGKPKQANLRRATSTAYYAMFHALAHCCADLLVGASKSSRSNEAWHQTYRSLEHGAVKNACASAIIKKFPLEIQDFAALFVSMQKKRHDADYNPKEKFYKSATLIDIRLVESTIKAFKDSSAKDKRAFAIFTLLKLPRK